MFFAGVDERNIHEDRASSARDDRPGLKLCRESLRRGDVLIAWKLDRLARSLPHLIEIIGGLRAPPHGPLLTDTLSEPRMPF
jgi:DNA invertase Pin-like site-specific DNA recombinase